MVCPLLLKPGWIRPYHRTRAQEEEEARMPVSYHYDACVKHRQATVRVQRAAPASSNLSDPSNLGNFFVNLYSPRQLPPAGFAISTYDSQCLPQCHCFLPNTETQG